MLDLEILDDDGEEFTVNVKRHAGEMLFGNGALPTTKKAAKAFFKKQAGRKGRVPNRVWCMRQHQFQRFVDLVGAAYGLALVVKHLGRVVAVDT